MIDCNVAHAGAGEFQPGQEAHLLQAGAASHNESEASLGGLRVLVVDDESVIRSVLTDLLDGMGPCVCGVSSGAAALEALDGESFDVLLVDLTMPVMDGEQLLRRIRAMDLARQPLAIIMSGLGVRMSDYRDGELGVFDVLNKPFVMSSIVEKLQAAASELRARAAQ
jgi:two-component system, sensor histidine kinase and response regulator